MQTPLLERIRPYLWVPSLYLAMGIPFNAIMSGTAARMYKSLGYTDGDGDALFEMLSSDHAVIGLADGGAHCNLICDASTPTWMLTHWCRDRNGEQLTVPFVVQAQCRDTAWALGLRDRGVLAPGYKADVNVIDFERLSISSPECPPRSPFTVSSQTTDDAAAASVSSFQLPVTSLPPEQPT